jgi:GAF domain-containing protein
VYTSILYFATFIVNLLGLVIALWLGLYLISRNPKYTVAWLTALMLWCMSGVFLNVLLAINPPPAVALKAAWLRYLFPFWPQATLAGSNNNWLQGWSVTPALALWHHVTVLLLPGKTTIWRWMRILLGYLLAVVATIVQTYAPILFTTEYSDPLYLNSLVAGPWYPIFAIALVILTWTCVINLYIASRTASSSMARKQLLILASAALVAGLTGPVSIIGSYYRIPIPMLVISLLEGLPIGLIGWSVARYSALTEGRTIQRDFVYNLLLLGLVLIIYVPFSWLFQTVYKAPVVILVVFPALAVITHSSITVFYRLMDRFFYAKETRQLRLSLHQLSRMVGVDGSLEALLGPSLDKLGTAVTASYGLILIFDNADIKQVASYHFGIPVVNLNSQILVADDVIHLYQGQLPYPLDEASLLVPLYGEVEQLGALVLGQPVNGLNYAEEDISEILDFADHFSEAILISRRNSQYIAQIAQLVQAQSAPISTNSPTIPAEGLELALRNLYDFDYLADNPLAELKLVKNQLSQGQITHLDRGKVVQAVLLESLEKLRPRPEPPGNPPLREWYPYLILQEAYLKETSNRDIMLKLYISEGTFNRTRRAAIRSLARTLGDMETLIS